MSNNNLSKKHKAIKSIKPIALKSIICLDLMKVEQSQVTGVVINCKMPYCFKFSFEFHRMEERKSLVNNSPIGRNITEGLGSGDQRPY